VRDRLHTARNLWLTRHPVTFNEKVRYRMARDRRPLLVTFADKVAVTDHVAARIGEHYLPRRFATASDLASIDRNELPREFVLKASHLSGGVVIVWDGAPIANTVPAPSDDFPRVVIRPSRVDWDALARLTDGWMRARYRPGPYGEWAYWGVPPRIVVDELLLDASGRLPDDYKLYVFDGTCRFVNVIADRFGSYRDLWFTPDWTPIDASGGSRAQQGTAARPSALEEMLEIASALGRGVDFVRVDLYDCGDRIVFGELTNYPAAGTDRFPNPTLDIEMGRAWRLARR
jgi:hypothetical protein